MSKCGQNSDNTINTPDSAVPTNSGLGEGQG